MKGRWETLASKLATPFRPKSTNNRISQPFSDGVVRIYNVEDISEEGLKPKMGLDLLYTLRYDERKVGISRFYAAKQNQVEVERVLRVPRVEGLCTQQVAITEDGEQYRIDLIQLAADVYPASVDITLAKVKQIYAAEVIRN